VKPILWMHGDCLSPQNAAYQAYPNAPAVFVFDDALLAEMGITLKRVMFMYECLLEMPVTIRRGDVVTEVLAFAYEQQAHSIATVDSPSPRFHRLCAAIGETLPVEVLEEIPFLDYDGQLDLGRFSRYWREAQRHLFD
jgi:hypothetical protein